MARGAAAVAAVRGEPGALFRPSGTTLSTATIRAAAQAAGYQRCVSFDVNPVDYTDPSPAVIGQRVAAALTPGAIVSLHLGHPATVAALPSVLDALDSHGLRAVTVSTLLAGPGAPRLAS